MAEVTKTVDPVEAEANTGTGDGTRKSPVAERPEPSQPAESILLPADHWTTNPPVSDPAS